MEIELNLYDADPFLGRPVEINLLLEPVKGGFHEKD